MKKLNRIIGVVIISIIMNSVWVASARAQLLWWGSKDKQKEQPAQSEQKAQPAASQPKPQAEEPKIEETAVTPPDVSNPRAAIEANLKDGTIGLAKKNLKDLIVSGKHVDLNAWATRTLYKIAQKEGSVTQTISELRARDPGDNPGLKRAIAEGYVRLKDWSEVVRIYEGMAQADPEDAVVKIRLIDYYILAGQHQKAIDELEPRVTANPDDTYNSDLLMDAYVKAGMKDKALALFKKRVDAAPSSPGLRGRYAQALEDLGLLTEALQQWQKAAELDPSNRYFQIKVNEVSSRI